MNEARDIPLDRQLRKASAARLLELVIEHGREMGLKEARQVLLNPHVDAKVIAELASVRRVMAIYEVKGAIARHPRAPEVVAMRLLSGLFWRELAEVVLEVRVRPGVRRAAEGYLVKRLSRLSVGEKAALARRSGAELLAHLRHDPSPLVVKAVLENPRLTEETLLPMVASEASTPRNLELVARNPRWGRRFEVRVALSRNAQAPPRAVLEILPTLRAADLEAVAAIEKLSWLVRHRAKELLEERS